MIYDISSKMPSNLAPTCVFSFPQFISNSLYEYHQYTLISDLEL